MWQINSTFTITMQVNTSECNFPSTPLYFVDIIGQGSHFCLTGYNAIYLPTTESFQIYAQYRCPVVTMDSILLLNLTLFRIYNVSWVGFYK